jgi:hypothetical protein
LSLEARIARLEAAQPRVETAPRFLDPRAPFSWLPRGIQRLTQKQSAIFLDPARFRVCVAGRRSGKTYLEAVELIRAARTGHDKLCWGILPTYRQCRTILWPVLKGAIPSRWIASKNETDLSITLKGYGSTIALRSADNPDSLRGSGLDFAVLDEFSSMSPEVWGEIIRPALADKQGGAIIQGSPRGYNHLHDVYTSASETPGWSAFRFSTSEGGLVAPEEIEAVRASLDPVTFGQEFEASFEQSTSRVYLMFSREHNVRADITDTGGDLLVGIDFNVNPMSAVLGVKAGNELHIVDEISLFNSNTMELAEALKQKYPPPPQYSRKVIPKSRVVTYPDPTGRARKTSAVVGVTDFALLEQAGLRVIAPYSSYGVADRINTVNALLCNAKGLRRLFIHPRCKRLIDELERLPYKDGTNLPDKSLGLDHHTDALGYLIMAEYPITTHTVMQSVLGGF